MLDSGACAPLSVRVWRLGPAHPSEREPYVHGIRRVGGGALAGVFGVLYCLLGLVSLVVNLIVVNEALGWGFLGIVLALIIFPVTVLAAPLYALIAWGNPFPLLLTYGGFALLLFGGWLAATVAGDSG